MALKKTNKNRKKTAENNQINDYVTGKEPINKWWWFTDNVKFYYVVAGILVFVLILA